ncbi:hypothetical protein CKG00_03925 [Morganella morganii]|uniref:Uncharacterized protein n=1 Tax=Morganella morganii TaxID=582 RepID=A0A433ZZ05_MORMO|nr:hypothetical protein [Morganella morganii]RUT67363.1 hypothetical protein CKG00_03925 [Morganella morganii]
MRKHFDGKYEAEIIYRPADYAVFLSQLSTMNAEPFVINNKAELAEYRERLREKAGTSGLTDDMIEKQNYKRLVSRCRKITVPNHDHNIQHR